MNNYLFLSRIQAFLGHIMKPTLVNKLLILQQRYVELGGLLSDPSIINDQNRYREYSKEYASLEPIVTCFRAYQENLEALTNVTGMENEKDLEFQELIQDEINSLKQTQQNLEQDLQFLLLPKDPNDDRNVYLEIRAGTGGNEASIFAGDLFRMYTRYAEQKGWQLSVISQHLGEQGGFKEIISLIRGEGVYSQLKFESGVHRVQRVPVTEAQGRIHTSACTVAVLPEVVDIDHIDINTSELRIDTFRASGAGGQHVNKTDSAIRITHLPSGIVVECQDERSQHKNKARALALLQSKLLSQQREKQQQEQAATRRSLVGSGDRSERIRTYNFPQGRVTDHRIQLTLYQLDDIIAGDLDAVIKPLTQELQAELLSQMSEESY